MPQLGYGLLVIIFRLVVDGCHERDVLVSQIKINIPGIRDWCKLPVAT
jgi:hypothetical protein